MEEVLMISKEMLQQITGVASKIAAEVAVDTYKKESTQAAKEAEKKRFDKRYKNTMLLLEHYRDFSYYGDQAIYRIYEELDEDLLDIVDMMEGRSVDHDSKIEAIERGVMRTRIIMNHVNTMLDAYKRNCEESPFQEEQRKWRIIEGLYLKEPPESAEEIARREFISERTVYRDVKTACRQLTALLFGIDGLER